MRTRIVLLVVVLLALGTTAPIAAQTVPAPVAPRLWIELNMDQQDLPVVPGGAPTTFEIRATVRCLEKTIPVEPIRIEHSVAMDQPWATVALERTQETVHLDADQCAQGSASYYSIPAAISVDATAPAFELATLSVEATTDDHYGDTYHASFHFRAGFLGGIRVDLSEPEHWLDGGMAVRVPIKVYNDANGAVQASVQLLDGGKNGVVMLPGPIHVDSVVSGARRSYNTFDVEYLAERHGTEQVRLRVTAWSALATDVPAGTRDVTFTVHVDGDAPGTMAGELPGVSPLITVGLLALGLLRQRR